MTEDIHELHAAIDQSRSRYQLERFVVGQHHTPEMQYVQLVRELHGATNALEEGMLKIELMRAEAEELRESGLRSDQIAADIKERSIEKKLLSLESTKREIAIMHEMLEAYPRYTRDQIEAGQERYWQERLVRVAQMQALAGGVGWAHIEALWQADAIGMLSSQDPLGELMRAGPPQLMGSSSSEIDE